MERTITSSLSNPKFQENIRSIRSRQIDLDDEQLYKNNCYQFFDKKNNRYKNKEEIIDNFKCQYTKNRNRILYYKRNDKNEYDFVSKTKLDQFKCIDDYKEKYDPEKKLDGHISLQETDLYLNCSDNSFRELNSDYDDILKYAYNLAEELHVDEQIKKFIINLVIYTNIDKDSLKEVFSGAFVIIRDKGFFYNTFRCESARFCDTKKILSESSHDSLSKDQQYRIGNGILYNCSEDGTCNLNESNNVFDLLVGTSPIENFYGDTWFQFEYANILGNWNKYVLHAYSFVKHKLSGKNVGPLGESSYAEYVQPLILDICIPETCNEINQSETKCQPIACVRPKIDLHSFSDNYMLRNHIILSYYKYLKDLIKSNFRSTSNITIENVYRLFQREYDSYDFTNIIIPYLSNLSSTDNYKYNREQIIEIVFLIYYYANNNITNYEEITQKLNDRYLSSRLKGGRKKQRKTRKNKKLYRNRKTRRNY